MSHHDRDCGTEIVIEEVGIQGPPGVRGPAGPALPGIEISDALLSTDGRVSFEVITIWGIDSNGDPYMVTSPDVVPDSDAALLDIFTFSLVGLGI